MGIVIPCTGGVFPGPAVGLHSFSSLGVSNPGSAHINGGSTLWVYSAAAGRRAYDRRLELDHDFGQFAISYGINSCAA
jgi:hypothetical protein